jgi:hypothetical protein
MAFNCMNIVILHRNQEVGENGHELKERGTGAPIRLDAESQAYIEKHRYVHCN